MVNIFEYTDFRQYLSDFYNVMKEKQPSFSYQYLANKAEFLNKGYLYNIIRGTKMLSNSSIFKLSRALGHDASETEYFESLVAFNQAKNLAERNFYFNKLNKLTAGGTRKTKAQMIRKDQYEFYSNWYHVVIRSIIDMYDFTDDYKWLARKVYPPITSRQARQSVALLLKLGLIEMQENGGYRVTSKSLTTGDNTVSLAVQNFHVECTELAKKILHDTVERKRNITGLTLGISEQTYNKICEETAQFQQNIMRLANADDHADSVYQFNFHLFPLSQSAPERNNDVS